MSKNLVIVESPAKAKTIEKFLGTDYHVMSSQGHIRDIEGIGKNSTGIDFDNNYQPNYVIEPQKHHLLNQLRTEVKKADTVWLASDEDREGEAIAWHLHEVLDLKNKNTHRIVFHEITKSAIQEAILHPRDIDYNLVNAQQARRVLDRIVGFEMSENHNRTLGGTCTVRCGTPCCRKGTGNRILPGSFPIPHLGGFRRKKYGRREYRVENGTQPSLLHKRGSHRFP